LRTCHDYTSEYTQKSELSTEIPVLRLWLYLAVELSQARRHHVAQQIRIDKVAGTTERTFQFDFFGLKQLFTTAR
jgi:hypothetical protein